MKPRNLVEQAQSCTRLNIDLIEHDGRHFLECNGRQIDAQHLDFPHQELMSMVCQPFRPAKQPRLIFLGMGFGHAVAAARSFLPQEKASFIIFPEAEALAEWTQTYLPENPLDDERVHIENLSPFRPIPTKYSGSQAVIMDLEYLEGLSPVRYKPTHPTSLHNIYDSLKTGGLLAILGSRLDTGLKRNLQKCGFDVAHEFVPLSEKSKRNRTLYLARKGHYQSNR